MAEHASILKTQSRAKWFVIQFLQFIKSNCRGNSHSLVCSNVVLRGLWKAKHPAHDPAAVETPTLITDLPPSPSMPHFHHTLGDQVLPLGSHEDGTKTDLLDSHLALEGETHCIHLLNVCIRQNTETDLQSKPVYLVLVVSLEPWDLIGMSVSVVAVSWMPAGVHLSLPLRGGAAVGPDGSSVASTGRLVQPALGRAHHPQVFAVLTVVHPPAVVFAVP